MLASLMHHRADVVASKPSRRNANLDLNLKLVGLWQWVSLDETQQTQTQEHGKNSIFLVKMASFLKQDVCNFIANTEKAQVGGWNFCSTFFFFFVIF